MLETKLTRANFIFQEKELSVHTHETLLGSNKIPPFRYIKSLSRYTAWQQDITWQVLWRQQWWDHTVPKPTSVRSGIVLLSVGWHSMWVPSHLKEILRVIIRVFSKSIYMI